jgi:ABC-type phosphate transport system auxiliary subunit
MLVSTDTIDRELQARLLKETSDLYARKQKLEDDIRSLDAVNSSLQGTAALRDIEAHTVIKL